MKGVPCETKRGPSQTRVMCLLLQSPGIDSLLKQSANPSRLCACVCRPYFVTFEPLTTRWAVAEKLVICNYVGGPGAEKS